MRKRKRTPGVISEAVENRATALQFQRCLEGENLATFLESFRREMESTRDVDSILPYKYRVKQQFSIGVNEVTRVLERMPLNGGTEQSCKNYPLSNLDASKIPVVNLQAILLASDCNPKCLTRHLPDLAISRDVPLIFVKDNKRGSLRLGELIKMKTVIAIGIKARGSSINQLTETILLGDKVRDPETNSFI